MKFRATLFTLLLALVTSLALACGDDEGSPSAATPTASSATHPAATATKASGNIILATTTSTQDSGLLDVLVPMFEDESGYSVMVIAVGSGQAIEMGSRGDADVVLAHSPRAEEEFVARGDGIERNWVMYNDFIIVGPQADPAGVAQAADAADALTRIFNAGARFTSRGDDSGTHTKELGLWSKASLDPTGQSWYAETGQGMGATLQVASQQGAYTLSDRATFLAQRDNLDLEIVNEGDGSLLNPYTVIVVNPDVHSGVNAAGARAFAAFLVRDDIQDVIAAFGMDEFGEPLFFPSAGVDPTAG